MLPLHVMSFGFCELILWYWWHLDITLFSKGKSQDLPLFYLTGEAAVGKDLNVVQQPGNKTRYLQSGPVALFLFIRLQDA